MPESVGLYSSDVVVACASIYEAKAVSGEHMTDS